jgi:hypothetical protein
MLYQKILQICMPLGIFLGFSLSFFISGEENVIIYSIEIESVKIS